MTIANLLASRNGEVVSVTRGTRVSDAVTLLADRRIGAVPVLDDDQVIGIMSERDIIYHLRSGGAAILDWPVERVMTAPVHTVDPQTTLIGALALMTQLCCQRGTCFGIGAVGLSRAQYLGATAACVDDRPFDLSDMHAQCSEIDRFATRPATDQGCVKASFKSAIRWLERCGHKCFVLVMRGSVDFQDALPLAWQWRCRIDRTGKWGSSDAA